MVGTFQLERRAPVKQAPRPAEAKPAPVRTHANGKAHPSPKELAFPMGEEAELKEF